MVNDKFRSQLNPYSQGCGCRLPGSGSDLREKKTDPTGWSISYRKYILQITQPYLYRYAKLQYKFAVISGSPSICPASKARSNPGAEKSRIPALNLDQNIHLDPQAWPDWIIRNQGTPNWEIHLITYHRRRFMYSYLQDLL